MKFAPATRADARRRIWLSFGVFVVGYAVLAYDNFFLPGGFNMLLGVLCLIAMALGLIGFIVRVVAWWTLRRRAVTGRSRPL